MHSSNEMLILLDFAFTVKKQKVNFYVNLGWGKEKKSSRFRIEPINQIVHQRNKTLSNPKSA